MCDEYYTLFKIKQQYKVFITSVTQIRNMVIVINTNTLKET